jgi:hypothetical protein
MTKQRPEYIYAICDDCAYGPQPDYKAKLVREFDQTGSHFCAEHWKSVQKSFIEAKQKPPSDFDASKLNLGDLN